MKKEETIKGWKVQQPAPKTWLYGPHGEILLKREESKVGFKIFGERVEK